MMACTVTIAAALKAFLLALMLSVRTGQKGAAFDLDTPLNQVPMLMSHDSATGYLGEDRLYGNPRTPEELLIAWSKTQIGNITQQLDCGARAFDMRPYLKEEDSDSVLIMHHGSVLVNYLFRDAMQEMVDWAKDHSNSTELIVAEISHCEGSEDIATEQCVVEAARVLDDLGIKYLSEDNCQSALMDMTLGSALEYGRVKGDGNSSVLAISGSCFQSNYDPSINCRGYEYESAGVSRQYSCWEYGLNPGFPLRRMLEHLDSVHKTGPPSNGSLWQMQALWQSTENTVGLGQYHNSSLLLEEQNSRLNRLVFEDLLLGRWNRTNLLEVDFVCDQGSNIKLALDPDFNGTAEEYPDDVVLCEEEDLLCKIRNGLAIFLPTIYRGPIFSDYNLIRTVHRIRRWGNHKDIVRGVKGSQQEQDEYKAGVFGIAILLWCILGVWGLIILYLKYKKWLTCTVPASQLQLQPAVPLPKLKHDAVDGKVLIKTGCETIADSHEEKSTVGSDCPGVIQKNVSAEEEIVALCEGRNGNQVADSAVVAGKGNNEGATVKEHITMSGGEGENVNSVSIESDGAESSNGAKETLTKCSVPSCEETQTSEEEQIDVKSSKQVTTEEGPLGNEVSDSLDDMHLARPTDMGAKMKKFERRTRCSRITVLTCGSLVLVFSILLITLGFDQVDNAIDSAQEGLPALRFLFEEANNATDILLVESNNTIDARVRFLNVISSECPLGGTLLPNQTLFDFDGIEVDDITWLNSTLDNFTFVYDELEKINITLNGIARDIFSAEYVLEKVDDSFVFYILVGFIIMYDISVMSVMGDVIITWRNGEPVVFKQKWSTCSLIVVVILLVSSYVVATFLLVIAITESDICIDTPDNQVIRLIDAPPPFDEFVEWYVRACEPELRPDLLFDYYDIGVDALRDVNQLLIEIVNLDATNVPCVNAGSFIDSVSALQVQLDKYMMLLYDANAKLLCEKINPIYASLVYVTACEDSFHALAQSCAYLLVIAVCSMTIITIHLAWLGVDNGREKSRRSRAENTSN